MSDDFVIEPLKTAVLAQLDSPGFNGPTDLLDGLELGHFFTIAVADKDVARVGAQQRLLHFPQFRLVGEETQEDGFHPSRASVVLFVWIRRGSDHRRNALRYPAQLPRIFSQDF